MPKPSSEPIITFHPIRGRKPVLSDRVDSSSLEYAEMSYEMPPDQKAKEDRLQKIMGDKFFEVLKVAFRHANLEAEIRGYDLPTAGSHGQGDRYKQYVELCRAKRRKYVEDYLTWAPANKTNRVAFPSDYELRKIIRCEMREDGREV